MKNYQISIDMVPDDNVTFIRALRMVGRMSLKKAADLSIYFARHPNAVLIAGIDKLLAERIAEKFVAAGAAVSILPSSIATPLVCAPEATTLYEWTPLRLLSKPA